jgi:hypothetical protein
MEIKSWWKSKTLWINALTILAGVGQQISGLNIVPPQYLALGLAVVNMTLRAITTQPIGK